MDKLTSIVAVVETEDSGIAVLDKAVVLARRFAARVEVMVTKSRLLHALVARCAQRRYASVRFCGIPGDASGPRAALLRLAHERRPDLVIKAMAGVHPLRRWSLGTNDRQLAQQCPVPLLLVGSRPWSAAPRMAACVDVADEASSGFARAILQAAGFLATGSNGFLDVLYSEREERDERMRMERAVRLAQLVREFYIGSERLQIFDGAPQKTLPRLLAARRYDVLVLGALTHRTQPATWSESFSSKLVDATSGDVLLVKPAGCAVPDIKESAQQRAQVVEQFV